jgi:uncharacterized membrane protein YfcA
MDYRGQARCNRIPTDRGIDADFVDTAPNLAVGLHEYDATVLSPSDALVILAGALAGGFINGLAGFGTGLVALGFWLHVIDPAPAATLAAACSVISQVQTMPAIWHAIDMRRIWPMVAAGLLGVPVGTVLLSWVDLHVFRLCVGLFLIGFSSFMLLGRARTPLIWGGRTADGAIGFGGGVLGGLAGLSGPLPIVLATLRGWSKDERRGVFQVFNLVILAATVLLHVAIGLHTAGLGWLVGIALPGTVTGAWLGSRSYRRLSDMHFEKVVLCLLAVSGVTLVWASR